MATISELFVSCHATVTWAVDRGDGARAPIYRTSRQYCRLGEGGLEMVHLAGPALPAQHLQPVKDRLLGWDSDHPQDEEGSPALQAARLAALQAAHQGRRYPWCVDVRTGMSGARDYRIRYRRNDAYADYPVGPSLHVSCAEKLNEGIALPLCDVLPLLAAVTADYPPDGVPLWQPEIRLYPLRQEREWSWTPAGELGAE